jgi:hypothetical protein
MQTLVRALHEIQASGKADATLSDLGRAIKEMKATRDDLSKHDGLACAQETETQSFRIANQDGQLQRYEKQLADAGLGKGERPCWVKPDGTIEFLYDVVLASKGIRMREIQNPLRARERDLLPMPQVEPDTYLSQEKFRQMTYPLFESSLALNCRFFVVIYDDTLPTEKERYKSLLRTVEGHFYKRLDRGPAPF